MFGLMTWLKQQPAIANSIDMTCVLMRNGAMRSDFEKICKTYTWEPPDLNKPERIHKRMATLLLQRGRSDPGVWLTRIVEQENPDIIYLSTLVLGRYLQRLRRRPSQKIITHVHELPPSLRQLSGDHMVRVQLQLSDQVICCAPCVQQALVDEFELSPDKCRIIPEFISTNEFTGDQTKPEDLAAVPANEKEYLEKISEASQKGLVIFGIGGNPIHRKGFDLFPLLINACQQQFADIPFLAVWIGCGEGSESQIAMEWDLKRMGLTDRVLLLPSMTMPSFRRILSHFRVLTLLSREDPFPLVVLEAASLGIPTVCFEGTGAIPEFAIDHNCISVAYLDLTAFAGAVHRLCLNSQEAESIAANMKRKVERDLTAEKVLPQLTDVLLNVEV